MIDQWWSWVLGFVGLVGFVLAGKKVWWAWYVNLANQILWFAYSILSEQYGFLVVTVAYTIVFTKNAISWTKEHRLKQKAVKKLREPQEKVLPYLHPNIHRAAAGLPESPPGGASKYGWCHYERRDVEDSIVWMCFIHNQPSRHNILMADSMLPCLEMDPYPEDSEKFDANRNRDTIGVEFEMDQPKNRKNRSLPPRGPDGRFRPKQSD